MPGKIILMQVYSYFHKRAIQQLKNSSEWAISIVVLTHAPANFRECCATTHVVVPGRNWTLFRCIFWSHYQWGNAVTGGAHMRCEPMNTWHVYTVHMSPTLNRSSAFLHFKHGNAQRNEQHWSADLRRKLDDKCLCLSYVFGSVLACAKSAHVFQKLVTNV